MKTRYLLVSALFIITALILSSCKSTPKSMRVVDLRCEYLSNPLGIDNPAPHLGWKLEADGHDRSQSAYRILAASSPDLLNKDTGDLWDSGRVNSDQSVYIPYAGAELASRQQVYWKVQVWDEKGAPSPWSKTAYWEMSIYSDDWQAKWIGVEEDLSPESFETGPAPYFRKTFKIEKTIKSARAYVSGLGYYELSFNGNKTGENELVPAQTNYDKRALKNMLYHYDDQSTTRVLYNVYDITDQLIKGSNAAGIVLGNGWYNQRDRRAEGWIWYNTPRFILQIEIEYNDGEHETIVSDDSWQFTTNGPIRYNSIFIGEHYDARLEMPGWNTIEFNADSWQQAKILNAPTGELQPQLAPADRVIQSLKPVSVKQTDNNVYIYDFGQMFSGWVRLDINGKRGDTLRIRHIEEMGFDYSQEDKYICKGGAETWQPRFTWHAFRTVEVSGSSMPLDINSLTGQIVNTDVDTVGTFHCSNPLFNKIYENYIWTQLGNFHGSFSSDCPHRERLGYTGDGSYLTETSIFIFDMYQFYRKWVNDIDDARNKKTGYVPHTAPYGGGGGGPAWGSAYVIVPWFNYLYYGDSSILKQHYGGMKHWVDYLGTRTDDEGIVVREEPNGWCLGDWATPDPIEIPEPLVNTCYYYYCTKLVAEIANVLGETQDRDSFNTLADKISLNLNKRYFNENEKRYWTSYQGADVFPLAFGMVNKDQIKGVFTSMVENVIKNRGHLDTGILATPLILDVLTDMGREDVAFMIMNQRDYPSFGEYIIGKGATTLWEYFDGSNSHSHPMYGSVIRWFYKALAGINPDPVNPGFKHIIIKPVLCGDLTHVQASHESSYGTISSEWKLKGENLTLDLEIPVNTTATVHVPATDQNYVREKGKSIIDNKNISFIRMEKNAAVYEIGSGKYRFTSQDVKKLIKPVHLPTPIITNVDTLYQKPDPAFITITASNNAEIYYTLDGSEPTLESTRYTGSIKVSDNTLVRTIAAAKGFLSSYEKSERVRFIDPAVNGLAYTVHEGEWTERPDLDNIRDVSSGRTFEFDVNKIKRRGDWVAITFNGNFDVQTAGEYIFYSAANNGSVVYVDGKMIVDNAGYTGKPVMSGTVTLTAGRHALKVFYYENDGTERLDFSIEGPGIEKQPFPPEWMIYP